jgi:hypothetical protein
MSNGYTEIYSQLWTPLLRGPRGALFLSALILEASRLVFIRFMGDLVSIEVGGGGGIETLAGTVSGTDSRVNLALEENEHD